MELAKYSINPFSSQAAFNPSKNPPISTLLCFLPPHLFALFEKYFPGMSNILDLMSTEEYFQPNYREFLKLIEANQVISLEFYPSKGGLCWEVKFNYLFLITD